MAGVLCEERGSAAPRGFLTGCALPPPYILARPSVFVRVYRAAALGRAARLAFPPSLLPPAYLLHTGLVGKAHAAYVMLRNLALPPLSQKLFLPA